MRCGFRRRPSPVALFSAENEHFRGRCRLSLQRGTHVQRAPPRRRSSRWTTNDKPSLARRRGSLRTRRDAPASLRCERGGCGIPRNFGTTHPAAVAEQAADGTDCQGLGIASGSSRPDASGWSRIGSSVCRHEVEPRRRRHRLALLPALDNRKNWVSMMVLCCRWMIRDRTAPLKLGLSARIRSIGTYGRGAGGCPASRAGIPAQPSQIDAFGVPVSQ